MDRQFEPRRSAAPFKGSGYGADWLGLANGAAMFVVHEAFRLIEGLPTALPGKVPDIGVFEVKRRQDGVEGSEFQKLPPVIGGALKDLLGELKDLAKV